MHLYWLYEFIKYSRIKVFSMFYQINPYEREEIKFESINITVEIILCIAKIFLESHNVLN